MSMPFDATMKALVQKFSSDYQTRFHLDSQEPLRLLNVDLSTITASADIVLADGDPPRILYHLEFQVSHYPKLSSRTLKHNALLHDEYAVPVHSLIVLLRREADGPSMTGGVEYETRGGRGKMSFGYEVLRLWEQPAEEFLAGGLGTLPLAPLCRLPQGVSREEALASIVHRVAERVQSEAAPDAGAEVLTATFVLTGMRVDNEVLRRLFLGVPAMHESSGYQIILEEGEVRGHKKTLLRLGRTKFGPPPPEMEAMLKTIENRERLERMIERLLTATSWEDLLATP